MAFESVNKRTQRMEVQQGLAKLAPISGIHQLFVRMKTLYGASNAWKELMLSNAVALENMNSGWGILDGEIKHFQATKLLAGWDVKYEKDTPTEEIKIMLNAHESLILRQRAYAMQSSTRAEQILRMQERMDTIKKENQHLQMVADNLRKENELLRRNYVQTNRNVEQAQKLNLQMIAWIVVALLFGCLLPVANAEQCDNHDGCILDTNQFSTESFSWKQVQLLCQGKGPVIIPANSVNLDNLLLECTADVEKTYFAHEGTYREWCEETIKNRFVVRHCTGSVANMKLVKLAKQFGQHLKMYMTHWTLRLVVNTIAIGIHLRTQNYLGIVLSALNYLQTDYVFLNAVKTSLLLEEYLLVAPLMKWAGALTLDYMALAVVCLLASVTIRFFTSGLQGVSASLLSWMLMLVLDSVNIVSTYFEIPEVVHYLAFPLVLIALAGLNYIATTVTIVKADGSVEKMRRYDLPRAVLTRVQSAVRGVIPAMPDKSHQICQVETRTSIGVGWRFMNNIYTLKHVVGEAKVVNLTWQGITTKANIVEELVLPESIDTLVKIKLPPELQGMKPFRLSKLETSDYMTLLALDNTMQPINYTGWVTVDGNWLSNSFETQPGNSGGPYMDRHGRLVGVHMGTQGVVAQGYNLTKILLQSVSITSVESKTTTEDELLYKLIDGTKKSHAALTSTIEQLVERVQQLERKLAENKKPEMKPQSTQSTQVVEEKKNRNRLKQLRERFSRIKVLTEEQYQEMLDKGWTKEEIDDAVRSLRDQAFIDYMIEHEEYDEPDFDEDAYFEERVFNYETGVKTKRGFYQTAQHVIVQEKKKRKMKPFDCKNCGKTFTSYHDVQQCRREQEKKKKKEKEKEKPKEEPKNSQEGGQRTPQ
nr:non-structural polyprotein [Crow astrovirus]